MLTLQSGQELVLGAMIFSPPVLLVCARRSSVSSLAHSTISIRQLINL